MSECWKGTEAYEAVATAGAVAGKDVYGIVIVVGLLVACFERPS